MSGIMTGKVESSGGDYAHIDDEGRYRAKMHFDIESPATAEATRPIRMSQPHAGPEYGMHFPLHADAEVAWACVNGDIDRPIIIGSVPNPSQKSPSLAENKMQNVVRTKSGNQMVLDDTIDKAQILINTPDANRMLFDDAEDAIIVETTNKHKVTLDDKNKRIEVKSTNGHFVLIQDGEGAKEGKVTVQSEAGHRISINDKDELITLVDESGDNIFQIDIGNKKLTIKTVDGDIEMLAENGTIDIKATTLNIETSADTNVTAGGKIVSEATMDHEMKANNIKMEAAMNFEEKAGMDLTSEAGLNHGIKGTMVKSEGSASNDVAAAAVSLKGSAAAIISGGIVKIN
jgi:type VI secretion system secreted protein VgrG